MNNNADVIIGNVYRTTNYDKFKRLKGNRGLGGRVKKIKKSIQTAGYILSPILVNEDFEVIDGQGRLEALKELGMAVDYIVSEGIGVEECIAMNAYQTSWAVTDYIGSYAETGNTSYVYLKQLLEEYGKHFSFKVILNAVTGKESTPNEVIKAGAFVCTKDDYDSAVMILNALLPFKIIIDRVDGNIDYYYETIAFCFRDPEVDMEMLLRKMNRLQANLTPIVNIQQALEKIEYIYNKYSKEHVYIRTNYRKHMEGKYVWYGAKWGEKYADIDRRVSDGN